MFGSLLKAMIPHVISATSHKCIACFEVTQCRFPCMGNRGPRANQHGNMLSFGGGPTLVFVSLKLHAIKHEPRNLPPIETCQVLASSPMRVSMLGQPKPSKHISLKHVTFWELCFSPFHPSSMFRHAIPIHNASNLFQLLHFSSNFHKTTLSRQLMKVMEQVFNFT